MKQTKVILLLLLITVFTGSASAITLDEILDRHAEALGGMEKMREFQSYHFNALINMGGIQGSAEMYYVRPDKIKTNIDLSILKIEQGLYNGSYWMKDQTGTVRELTGMELRQFVTENYISSYDYVLKKEVRDFFQFTGETEHGEIPCYVLEFDPPEGDKITMYINKENYLLEGSLFTVQGMNIKVTYSDWREKQGLMIPFKTVQDLGNPMLLTTITVTDAEVNLYIPESVFVPPGQSEKKYSFTDDQSKTTIDFKLYGTHIYIPVMINGKGPFSFILDSGAGMSIVSKDVFDSLGLEDAGNMPAAGVGGLDVGKFCQVESYQIGNLTLNDLSSGVLDFSQFNAMALSTIEGIIGYDLFTALIVEIDYENEKLTLYDPDSNLFPGSEDTLTCEIETNHPIIYAEINDSIKGRFRMDTGSGNYLDINAPMVKKYKLLDQVEDTLGTYPMMGVGGTSETMMAVLKSFTIGDTRFENVLTGFYQAEEGIFSVEGIDGNIGGGLMSEFKIAFDYPDRKVYLTKNTKSEEGEGKTAVVGLGLKNINGRFEVLRAMPNSSAYEAGLQTGDVILEIDGTKLDGMELADVYELLNGDEGTQVEIKYERSGEKYTTELTLKKLFDKELNIINPKTKHK